MPTAHKSDVNGDVRVTGALLNTRALQKAIFNSANFSSIATDAKGVIQIFNVGAERMLGYTAADVLNKITPADISDPQELLARATALSIELGTPIAPGFEALVFKASRGIEDIYELTYIHKDGSRFPAVVSVTALRDAHDLIIGYLLIGTDNTARQQVEEERRKLDQRSSSPMRTARSPSAPAACRAPTSAGCPARGGVGTSRWSTTSSPSFSRLVSPTAASAYRRRGWSSYSSRSLRSTAA
jgi:PAS domain-containing protein